ncbi:GL15357 [Drosophila persimilis]|uniref:GL15357 n=1 Tax=Drosophila persimilis TaxID=7234 RepID=B4IRI4_DROPE|nr:GL15357 [Drosophila persimilis]
MQRLKSSMLATTDNGHGDGGCMKAHVQKAVKLEYREPKASFVDIIPSAMISQAIEVNVCQAVNTTNCAARQFMHQHRSLEPEPTSPFFREDSDLDHEYDDRSGYLCQLESRPSYNTSQTDEKPLAGG